MRGITTSLFMKSSLRKIFFASASILFSLNALAYDFQDGELYYDISSDTDNTVAVAPQSSSFSNYSNLTGELTIPSEVNYNGKSYKVTSIGLQSLRHSKITSVIIPNSVTWIREQAFGSCELLESVFIPNSVKNISYTAFYGCINLTSVNIPASVKYMDNPFMGCTKLTSISVDPENPYFCSIDGNIYDKDVTTLVAGLPSLLEMPKIPETVNTIGYRAFQYSLLTEFILPETIKTIEAQACSNSPSLKSVTIPASVTKVGGELFIYCPKLTDVYCKAMVPPANSSLPGSLIKDVILYVPTGTKEAYRTAKFWKEFVNIVEMDFSGVDNVTDDNNGIYDTEVYNLSGTKVADSVENLAAGIYIVRNGNSVQKIIVR